MALLLKIFNKNLIFKTHRTISISNIVYRNIFRYQVPSMRVYNQKREIIRKRYSDKLDESKYRLNQYLKNSSSFVPKNDLYRMIHLAQTDDDIGLIVNVIKKMKNYSDEAENFTNTLFDLLYMLGKTDKANEILKDKEWSSCAQNRRNLYLVTDMLYKENRYEDVIKAFENYLEYHNWSQDELDHFIAIQITIVMQSLMMINTKESFEKMKYFLSKLDSNKIGVISSFCIILSSINQNELTYANDCINTLHSSNYRNFVLENLKIMMFSRLNKIDKAFEIVEKLISDKSLPVNIKKFFHTTINFLREAVEKSKNSKYERQFKELEVNLNSNALVDKTDLIETCRRYNEYGLKLDSQGTEELSSTNSTYVKPASSSSSSSSRTYNRNILNDPVPEPVISARKNNVQERPSEENEEYDDSMLLKKFRRLYAKKSYQDIVDLFESNVFNTRSIDRLKKFPPFYLTVYTECLLQINTKESFDKIKYLLEHLINNNIPISDHSKLHLFLMSINQNQPLYPMFLMTMSQVDRSNATLFKNLFSKIACKLNQLEASMDQLDDILNVKHNKFSIDGLIFPSTLNDLEDKLRTSHKNQVDTSQLAEKLNTILVRSRNEDRISHVDLEEFSSQKAMLLLDLPITSPARTKKSAALASSPTLFEKKIRDFYKLQMNSQLVDEFLKYLETLDRNSNRSEFQITQSTLDYFSMAILQTKINVNKLKEIINILKKIPNLKYDKKILINMYMALLKEGDPLYALEFLADFDREETLKKEYPTIYNNILAIGFSLIDKLDIALKQVEKIVNTSDEQVTNENNFNGMIFQLTLNNLEQAVNRSSNDEYKNRFNTLKQTLTDKKRIVTSCDLISLP